MRAPYRYTPWVDPGSQLSYSFCTFGQVVSDFEKHPVMRRQLISGLLLFSLATLLCFTVAEFLVRLLGEQRPTGNFVFRSTTLRPYRIPIEETRAAIARYQSASTRITLQDHPVLGWTYRPNSRSGIYAYNSAGLRSEPQDYPSHPSEHVFRIAVLGDSYTLGYEEPLENTWGYRLQQILRGENPGVEVLDFGVGGYGIDQAYLRWREEGRMFHPDLVIFGFQPENVKRIVNVLRVVYTRGTGICFSKPRFKLDGDGLKLVNVPTIPPDEIVNVLENIESWDLLDYEYFYDPGDYQPGIWYRSKFISLLKSALDQLIFRQAEYRFYALDKEPSRLALRIIEEFRMDVESTGAEFLVVHLPKLDHLSTMGKGRPLAYRALLDEIEDTCRVVHPERRILEQVNAENLVTLFNGPQGHYSKLAHEHIAQSLAAELVESCQKPSATGE